MTKEIEFRAKRLDNNKFVIGYYLPMVEGYRHYIYLPLEYLNEHSRIEIDPKTLGQYTGLKDKNGKKIFEGDIILLDGKKYLVDWSCDNAGFCFRSKQPDNPNYDIIGGFHNCSEFEIIGNWHENQELLTKEE